MFHAERQTGKTKLIGSFHHFANVPKTQYATQSDPDPLADRRGAVIVPASPAPVSTALIAGVLWTADSHSTVRQILKLLCHSDVFRVPCMFHVPCINQMHKMHVLKTPTNALEFENVTLLHSNYRHVSATRGSIFRMVRTRIQIKL